MSLAVENIVAERCLTFRDASSKATDVRVLVGKPERSAEAEYFCEVHIAGIGDEKVRAIYGVDSMQALQLALKFASDALSSYRLGLTWLGNEDIGL